jgi:hypothetical protein
MSKHFYYDPEKDMLMISRDVIFDEKTAWNWEGREAGPSRQNPRPCSKFQNEG